MRARPLLTSAALVAVAVTLAPGPGRATPACVKVKEVTMGDDADGNLFFAKSRVTIREGSCVRWTWTGTLDHQVEGKNLRSPLRTAPYRYRKRYSKARKAAFHIICTQHSISMRMKVKVFPRV